jgi:hypothetical protein
MSAEPRKVIGRDDALALLSELASTGESLVQFSRRRSVDARSLRCWKLNLTRGTGRPKGEPLRLMEVTLPPARPARYRVLVGDLAVEIADDFEEATLARLLAVVRSC